MCLILLKDEQAGEIVVANTLDFFRQKDSFRLYLAVWGLLGLKMCLNISLHFAPTTPTRTQRGTTHARLVSLDMSTSFSMLTMAITFR